MERRRGPLRKLTYGVAAFPLAGCFVSSAVTIARDATANSTHGWSASGGPGRVQKS
jgi:hypothetical protein